MKSRLHFCLLNVTITFLSSLWFSDAGAQTFLVDSLASKGDSLRMLYRFEEASGLYADALEVYGDTVSTREDSLMQITVKNRLLLSENGRNMSGFVHSPIVAARHRFSINDFFLYYPLKDRSWRLNPNQLDSTGGYFAKAIYAPVEDKSIYFSAAGENGRRDIYHTDLADTVWTRPAALDGWLTSGSNEIYPMLSPDGKSLFFASDGLFGVGGYDLYVSHLNEATGEWTKPVNMGFPYSSPANDFLLVNTDDGRHTIFASDRDCPKDSVWVYVLEFDRTPVREHITDPESLRDLSQLKPQPAARNGKETGSIKSEFPENPDARKYMDQITVIRSLKDSIAVCENKLTEYRERYLLIDNDTEKKKLAENILRTESHIPEFRSRLETATRQLQEIEMNFLFSGVIINPDRLLEEAEREIVSETPDYTFSKMTLGEPITLELEKQQETDKETK